MLKKRFKIVAVAVLVCGSVVGVGATPTPIIRSIVRMCCGGPLPICPGSPQCPASVAKR